MDNQENPQQTTSFQTTLSYFAVAAASAVVGYWVGVGASLGITRNDVPSSKRRRLSEVSTTSTLTGKGDEKSTDGLGPTNEEESEEEEDSDEEDEEDDPGLGEIKPGFTEECKLVLVVRNDLGMTKGKIAAQCGHATLACYKALLNSNPSLLKHWERIGQAKIALKAESEDELLLLQATAKSLNICARTIRDAGRTQIAAGSTTVLGVGPAPVRLVNQVTGHLKLL